MINQHKTHSLHFVLTCLTIFVNLKKNHFVDPLPPSHHQQKNYWYDAICLITFLDPLMR